MSAASSSGGEPQCGYGSISSRIVQMSVGVNYALR